MTKVVEIYDLGRVYCNMMAITWITRKSHCGKFSSFFILGPCDIDPNVRSHLADKLCTKFVGYRLFTAPCNESVKTVKRSHAQ